MGVFVDMIDLAAESVGGVALAASDEFFAPKENLLKSGRGVFIPDKFTENGKWMDGWETRRKRVAGHDWCIIRLGLPGIIHGLDIDTNHFVGNFPQAASIDACDFPSGPDVTFSPEQVKWVELVKKTSLEGGKRNLIEISNSSRFTHLRLNIYPDGGVARLRVHGEVVPDLNQLRQNKELVDLASVRLGSKVILANDDFFGKKNNVILPNSPVNMGDGWETKRKRRDSFEKLMQDSDWVIIRFGAPGEVSRIMLDTTYFRGNFPDTVQIDGCNFKSDTGKLPIGKSIAWKPILNRVKVQGGKLNIFEQEVMKTGSINHVRVQIFPDGGINRIRMMGTLA